MRPRCVLFSVSLAVVATNVLPVGALASGPKAGAAPIVSNLMLAPSDAWAALYLDDLSGLRSMAETVCADRREDCGAALLLDALALVDGALLISIGGEPLRPWTWSWDVAWNVPERDTDAYLRRFEQVIDTVNRAVPSLATLRLDKRADSLRLTVVGPLNLVFEGRIEANRVHFRSIMGPPRKAGLHEAVERPMTTAAWYRGLWNSDGAMQAAEPRMIFYVDVTQLLPLGLGQLEEADEWVTLVGADRIAHVAAAYTDRPGTYRLNVGFDAAHEIVDVLSSSQPSSRVFAPMGEGGSLRISGSTKGGESWIRAMMARVGAYAPEVSVEFWEDVLTFERDTGVAPMGWFANFAGDFVLEFSNDGDWAGTFGLRDPLRWDQDVSDLRSSFDLDLISVDQGGYVVQCADRASDRVCFVRSDDVLLVANRPSSLLMALDEAVNEPEEVDAKSEDADASGETNASAKAEVVPGLTVEWDTDWLTRAANRAGYGRDLAPFLSGITSARARLVGRERQLLLTLDASPETALVPERLFADLVLPLLGQAREKAQRVVSMSNVRSLLMGVFVYAGQHNNQPPSTLQELGPIVVERSYCSPYADVPDGEVCQRDFYLYVVPDEWPLASDADKVVVIAEPELRNGGAVFGFADGHVEHIEGKRAHRLLHAVRRTAVR
ncbi:MAG: hypothetical protein ACPGXK_15075 [Phycisphaerae bacterium]